MMEAEILQDRVILRGNLTVTHVCFNDISGEVIVRGTVAYHGVEFRDIPILTLRIYREMDEVKFQEIWYTARIPRLEAIADFRKRLLWALRFFPNTLGLTAECDKMLRSGLDLYNFKMTEFSVGKSLVRSLRHMANGLRENSLHDWVLARRALYALEVVPAVDVELIVEG